jgi:hypothetical protein
MAEHCTIGYDSRGDDTMRHDTGIDDCLRESKTQRGWNPYIVSKNLRRTYRQESRECLAGGLVSEGFLRIQISALAVRRTKSEELAYSRL